MAIDKKDVLQAINSNDESAWRDLVSHAIDALLTDNKPEFARLLMYAADIKQRDSVRHKIETALRDYYDFLVQNGFDPSQFSP